MSAPRLPLGAVPRGTLDTWITDSLAHAQRRARWPFWRLICAIRGHSIMYHSNYVDDSRWARCMTCGGDFA